jgi:2-dehydro-3-deoxygluconokinase
VSDAADPAAAGPILTVGEALVSLTAPCGIRLLDASSLHVHIAGAELNFAIALRRLGAPSAFAGAVGVDPWGERVRRSLLAEGVEIADLPSDDGRPTAVLFKEGASGPDLRVHYLRRGAAGSAYAGGEALREAARRARGLHLTGISLNLGAPLRAACLEALAALDAGAFVSFDLNVRHKLGPPEAWREAIELVADRAGLMLATREELTAVGADVDALGERLSARGAALMVRTDGAETVVHTAEGRLRVAPPPARGPVADAVGAGDAFAAAVVATRLGGADWPRAALAGHLAGGFAVGRLGDYEGAPYAYELDELLADGGISR